jgi:hypothetical protein
MRWAITGIYQKVGNKRVCEDVPDCHAALKAAKSFTKLFFLTKMTLH